VELTGLHLLLTYRCLFECDHCFVWGGPRQRGVMTLEQVRRILAQADDLEGLETIFFEGGEPFLHYAVLLAGARLAKERGYRVGIVSNAYWATDDATAALWLGPFSGVLDTLHLSDDAHHGGADSSARVHSARRAAEVLGVSVGVIQVPQPEDEETASLMFRGRAASVLSGRATGQPWEQFNECPHEDLKDPTRVHVDPFGEVQICQGISLGNLFQTPLREICANYRPEEDPVLGPLLSGGPAELTSAHCADHVARPADACHLCYETRRQLRVRFPNVLGPGQVYGEG